MDVWVKKITFTFLSKQEERLDFKHCDLQAYIMHIGCDNLPNKKSELTTTIHWHLTLCHIFFLSCEEKVKVK